MSDSSTSIALGGIRPPPGAECARSVSICVIRPQRLSVMAVRRNNNNVGISCG